MVPSGERPGEVASDKLQQRQGLASGSQTIQHETGTHTLQSKEGAASSNIPEKPLEEHDTGCHISQIDKEGSISSIIPKEVSQSQGTVFHPVQSGQEGRTPSVIREKVLEDGYHWRKYGQKHVKGNEFVRSYYRCTHPGCQVKKQLECSQNGQVTDVVYFREHDHPKQQINVPVAVGFVLSIAKEKPAEPSPTKVEANNTDGRASCLIKSISAPEMQAFKSTMNVKGAQSESNKIKNEIDNDDDARSKRQKKGSSNVDTSSVVKATDEPRLVIQTLSEVDIVNDGYRWRKYGQKLVKGNINPRSYYRCSNPGCPMKKHVERASHDPKVVITSYEGQHNHDMPASRTVTHNTTATGPNVSMSQSGAKSGESAGGSDIVADNGSGLNGKSKEQLNGELKSELKESNNPDSDIDAHSGSGHESKPNEHQNSKSGTAEETETAGHDTVSERGSNEQHSSKSTTESKENVTAGCARTPTAGPESMPNEKHILSSQPVQT